MLLRLSTLESYTENRERRANEERETISSVDAPHGDSRREKGRYEVGRNPRIAEKGELGDREERRTARCLCAEQEAAIERDGERSEPPHPIRASQAAESIRAQTHDGGRRHYRHDSASNAWIHELSTAESERNQVWPITSPKTTETIAMITHPARSSTIDSPKAHGAASISEPMYANTQTIPVR